MAQEELLKNLEMSLRKHLQEMHDEVKEAGLDASYISCFIFDHYGGEETYTGHINNSTINEETHFSFFYYLDQESKVERRPL